jgi:hypothetical protein
MHELNPVERCKTGGLPVSIDKKYD